MSISSAEVVFEDVNLGFRHKIALFRPAPGQTSTSTTTNNSRIENNPTYINPNPYPNNMDIPGIPNNIPRYNPNNPNNTNTINPTLQQQQQQQKKLQQQSDEDDDDGDN